MTTENSKKMFNVNLYIDDLKTTISATKQGSQCFSGMIHKNRVVALLEEALINLKIQQDFINKINIENYELKAKPTTEINIDYYEELKRKADFVDKMISPSANDIYKELNELKVKADKYDDCKVFIDLSLDMFASFLNSKTPFPVPVISLKQFQELKVKTDAYDKIMALTGTNDARLELTDRGAEELRHYLDKVREVIR